jgi:hypothetical protein
MRLSWGCFRDGSITVYASKVAVCADLHPYQSLDSLRDEYMYLAHGLKPSDDYEVDEAVYREKRIASLPALVRERVVSAIELGKNAESVKEVANVIDSINNDVDIPHEVASMIKSDVYTHRGTVHEDDVRERQPGKITKTNAFQSKLWFTLTDGTKVYLGGRHDGYDELNNRLVEIKVRQRRFLNVPEYERIQVHCYMHIFDTHRVTLIESYNDSQKEHNIMYNLEFWQTVTGNVKYFLESLLARRSNDVGVDKVDERIEVRE